MYVNEILDFDYPMLADTVTFAPGARNNWHVHQAGQILMVTDGNGWFTHIALEYWSKGHPELLEPVTQEDYEKLEDTDVG